VRLSGVAPELLALLAVLVGVYAGPDRGPVYAFALGLLWDIYLPSPLGVSATAFAVVAWSVGGLEAGLYHDNRFQLILIGAGGTAACVFGYALLGEVVGVRGLIDRRLLVVAALAAVWSALLTIPVAAAVRWAVRVPDERRLSVAEG